MRDGGREVSFWLKCMPNVSWRSEVGRISWASLKWYPKHRLVRAGGRDLTGRLKLVPK